MLSLRKIVFKVLLTLDGVFIQIFGIHYLRLLRKPDTLERCNYLIGHIRNLGRNKLRVLDAGCGAGLTLVYLDRLCSNIVMEYVGVDLLTTGFAHRFRYTKMPHRFLKIDLDSDWQLGKFDVVFCSEVLEHLIEDERLFQRLSDHVLSNGLVIVTAPHKNFFLEMAKTYESTARFHKWLAENTPVQDGEHVRIGYERNDFLKMADNCSLMAKTIDYISPFNVQEWGNYRKLRPIVGNILMPLLTAPRRRRQVPSVMVDPRNEELAVSYLSIAGVFQRKETPSLHNQGAVAD
jgi:SAM-dependent methyltransferase